MRITRQTVEQVTIYLPTAEAQHALHWCWDHGYKVTKQGVIRRGPFGHDTSRYVVKAQRKARGRSGLKKKGE